MGNKLQRLAYDLDSMTDVTLTSPASGNIIVYDGSAWVNDDKATLSELLVDSGVLYVNPFTDKVGINTVSPASYLDVYGTSGVVTAIFAEHNTNATTKSTRLCGVHYTNSEEPMAGFMLQSTSTNNHLHYGGGTALANAATRHSFYVWGNNTSVNSTEAFQINSASGALAVNYMRVGSLTAPSNVTAGDFTTVRLCVGSDSALSNSSSRMGAFSDSYDTTSTGNRGITFQSTFTPTANDSVGVLRNVVEIDHSFVGLFNYTRTVAGILAYVRMKHSGSISATIIGAQFEGMRQGGNESSFITYSSIEGVRAQSVNSFSTKTGSITTARAIRILAPEKGTGPVTIVTNIGLDIADLTGGTNNTNLLVGSSTTGNWSIYNNSASNNYFGTGNFGFGQTSFGTSAAKVIAIGNGTAPSTSPADAVQVWSADRGGTAGKAGLHIRSEDGTSHVFSDYVGINTTTPLANFEVRQPTAATEVMRIVTTSSNDDPTEHVYQFKQTTTDATITILGSLTINRSYSTMVVANVVARRTGGSAGAAEDGAAYIKVATFKNTAGTTALIGSLTSLYTAESQAGWELSIAPSATQDQIDILVTGATNNNITWHATVRVYPVGS